MTLSLAPNDLMGITFRLSMALLVGAIVGLERQIRHKPAGLRTHMLVSFGAALFVLIPLQISTAQEGRDAISRVIQGVAAGIGFLGAGEILHESHESSNLAQVRGLTSAAAIWVCAALGVAAGCGLWQMGLIGAVLSLVVLSVFKKFEKRH
ncbi:MAG TPA: MgtC/SapB family protein [Leptolyngbyaceae cyanobacterium]